MGPCHGQAYPVVLMSYLIARDVGDCVGEPEPSAFRIKQRGLIARGGVATLRNPSQRT
jgi:hypothetical protein